MQIAELSVRRPILTSMVYLLIAVIALVLIPGLDTALYPSVEMPIISVMVSCGDYGPEEIEQQVATVLEDQLYTIEGLSDITSNISSGNAMIMMEFEYGTDLDEVEDSVSSAISRVSRSLPSWAETPTIMRMDLSSSSSEVISLTLTGNRSLEELKEIADSTVEPLLKRVDGVADTEVRGGNSTIYEVQADPERLYAYGLTLTSLSSALNEKNSEQYIGIIEQNELNYQIVTDSRYMNASELADTIIATYGESVVHLSDVASIYLTEESDSRSFIDGNEVISISVSNESDSNASNVAADVIAIIPSIQDMLPEGVSLTVERDSTEMITSTMNEVYKSAYEGILLAALVIFLFLRNIRATIIIALSMPISILITLSCMSLFSLTINSMTMAGLILGIGMIVDASIIILENTYDYREKGYRSAASAILGSRNMFNAILASTFTTICVFLPLIIYKYDLGQIGMMFQDLIITICISLASSLFVAVTLVPALSGSILRIKSRVQKPIKNRLLRSIDDLMSRGEDALRRGYVKALDYVLSHKALFIMFLVLLLIFFCLSMSSMSLSMMPPMTSDDSLTLNLELKEGTVKEVTLEELFEMSDLLSETLPEGSFENISVNLASSSNSGTIAINLPDITEQTIKAEELKTLIRPLMEQDPSASWSFSEGRGFTSDAVDISITSEDETLIEETADEIVAILNNTSAFIDISSDVTDGSPKVNLIIDYDKAKQMGVTLSTLQSTLYGAVSGIEATEITTFDASKTYTVMVSLTDSFSSISDLESLTVMGSSGPVRLDQIASFEYGTAPKSITRENRQRVNHITANAAEGVSSDQAAKIAETLVNENLILPEGVTISFGGEMQEFSESLSVMIVVIILALALVYMVMAAQFESLIDPFIIFATIPLLLIGVIAIHLIMGQSFSLFSLVGIVALIGVVVNNGIVLVDSINQYVKEKIKVRDACLLAAKNRLRPILMTTLTTVLGMIPIAFFPGEGSEMLQPIGLTFFGGILTGSFLTLFLSPTLYLIFNKRREKSYEDPESLNNQLKEFDASK